MSTVLADAPPRSGRDGSALRLLLHAIALAGVLAAGTLFVRTGELFFVDEGAVISQSRAVGEGSWRIAHPAPEVDPEGRWFPIEYSEIVDEGAAGVPYAKHPVYPVVLAWLDGVGGIPAMVALSIAGTVAAGLAAAWLATTMGLSERAGVATLWIVGAGTPLLFDSYLVVAHTLAAAFVTVAIVATTRALVGRATVPWAVLAGSAMACASLLRTEAVLFGLAMAVGACAAVGPMRRRGVVAATLVASTGAAYLFDGWLHQVVIGESGAAPFVIRQGAGWLADRFESFYTTLLRPGFPDQASTWALSLTVVSACCAALVAGAARRARPEDRPGLLVLAAASVLTAIGGAMLAPAAVVPGLFAAAPALLWVLIWWSELWRDDDRWRSLLVASVVYVAAVLLLQYDSGGGPQWGGRYFAIAVPALVVLGVRVAQMAAQRLDRRAGLAVALSVLLLMAVGSGRSLVALRDAHEVNTAALAAIGDAVDSVGRTSEPLVITTSFVPPRLGVDLVTRHRWLYVPDDELDDALEAAAEAAEPEVVIVSEGLPALDGNEERAESGASVEPVGGWIVQRLCLDC